MQISGTLSTQSTQATQRPPPPPAGGSGGPPSHSDVVSEFAGSLSTEVQEAMLGTIATMEADGASHEEIKSYVDAALEEEGVAPPDRGPGLLVNMRV